MVYDGKPLLTKDDLGGGKPLYFWKHPQRIITSHCKDPYKPTRIQWKVIRFFFTVSLTAERPSIATSCTSGRSSSTAICNQSWSWCPGTGAWGWGGGHRCHWKMMGNLKVPTPNAPTPEPQKIKPNFSVDSYLFKGVGSTTN